jgi:small subunit ribosomal protein S8
MYYDLLTKIKNAEQAKKEGLTTPFSKMDFAVAKILAQAGYISDVQKKTTGRVDSLEIKLPKGKDARIISGVKIISKPSRRIYIKSQNLKLVKQGYGIAVISTSSGVMNNKDARKAKVGGEYLFEIW